MNTRIERKKKKKRWGRTVLFILLILAIGVGAYAYNVYNDVANAVNTMHNPLSNEGSDKREEKVEVKQKDPISVLLVGIDERDGDAGRTDSMMVLTINPELSSTKILSIPRDTRVKIVNDDMPKKAYYSKINHAYGAYRDASIETSIDTVEHFLNIPIDYYIEVNMEGFKDIVDAVGGIDVDNPRSFELDGVYVKKGPQHLNGEKALAYARMRKEDPRGDFGRQERQREVISKVIEKGVSLSSITNYNEILDALEKNIKTNLSLKEMINFQSNYKSAASTMDKMEIEGTGQTLDDNLWYYIVDDTTRQELSNQLRSHLELPTETVARMNSNSY
ncbi:LytR family transcriptional regulator [Robertmurraya yapensis]|uniref:LytR family transcriptional regulator n=1 Tax=Bacillus yapensis TaxID=2492960 RepID=A0A431WMG4_9BACI|nr:LCP family protein [Bacillus yapensis]RTR36409.1 LytR family transcriptional regulator [Bacillus yapensis]TKT05913.1 LytR family transcriptional regulator [Bacillus yapensis]